MKKFLLSMASLSVASLMLGAGTAGAQVPPPPPGPANANLMQAAMYGAPGPVASPYAVPVYGLNSPAPDDGLGNRYGLHPVLKRLFHIKGDSCGDCADGKCGKKGLGLGHGGHGLGGGYGPGVVSNPAQGGTLAFPQHPYVRSPRDFFYAPPK